MNNFLEELHIILEETRRKLSFYEKISSNELSDLQQSLEEIYTMLLRVYDVVPIDSENVYLDMIHNCKLKAAQLAFDATNRILSTNSKFAIIDDGIKVQKDIAHIVELSIRLQVEHLHEQLPNKGSQVNHETLQIISSSYTKYQRQLLRLRSKSSIANLASIRKDASLNSLGVISFIELSLDSQVSDDQNVKSVSAEFRPHAVAITCILSEASNLIHPLILWKDGSMDSIKLLESKENDNKSSKCTTNIEKDFHSVLRNMCHDTTLELHSEAKSLTITVCEWFLSDIHELDKMPNEKYPTVRDYPSDGLLEELVFVCQVIQRYINFSKSFEDKYDGNLDLSLPRLLTESVLLYTTQESKLITSNTKNARALAQPVQVIMGLQRFVPSVVEDIYFITHRSLERANMSMVPKAVSILASFVTDVWSESGAVYDSLMKQEGCCVLTVNEVEDKSSFGVLLSKFEKDKKMKAPSSEKNVDVHQIQMDTQLCLLNGIFAASTACLNLSNLFVDLLHDDNDDNIQVCSQDPAEPKELEVKSHSMIQLANDEMKNHAQFYEDLLCSQINVFVEEWIGVVNNTTQKPPLVSSLPQSPCLHRMFHFFSNQEYNINASVFHAAESRERIELMLEPLKCSRIMHELQSGKCDEVVSLHLVSICSHHIATMLLWTLINQKKFSEWGSLLLSKQVRNLEGFLCSQVIQNESNSNTSMILREFQKLTQAVTILQCTKPSDWMAFEGEVGNSKYDLTREEIRKIMMLRLDWTIDAIDLQLR